MTTNASKVRKGNQEQTTKKILLDSLKQTYHTIRFGIQRKAVSEPSTWSINQSRLSLQDGFYINLGFNSRAIHAHYLLASIKGCRTSEPTPAKWLDDILKRTRSQLCKINYSIFSEAPIQLCGWIDLRVKTAKLFFMKGSLLFFLGIFSYTFVSRSTCKTSIFAFLCHSFNRLSVCWPLKVHLCQVEEFRRANHDHFQTGNHKNVTIYFRLNLLKLPARLFPGSCSAP